MPVPVTPNGIDLTQFRPVSGGVYSRMGIPAKKKLIRKRAYENFVCGKCPIALPC